MSQFLDKFNEYSDGRFSYLRLKEVKVLTNSKTAEFHFVCPEDKYGEAVLRVQEITRATQIAAETELKVAVQIIKSHFDPRFFTRALIEFFDYYASLRGCVSKSDVSYGYDDEKQAHKVQIAMKESAFDSFMSRDNLMRELNDYINSNYCENIEITVVKSQAEEDFGEAEDAFSFDEGGGRFIRVDDVRELVGYAILDPASYICDARAGDAAAFLCGRVGGLKEIARKPKEGGAKDGKPKPNFFKFTLTDGTGIIPCVYFATDKAVDKFRTLNDGAEVVVEGRAEANAFEGGALNFYVRRLSLCKLPKDFKVNRLKLSVPKKYKNVFPQPYTEFSQTDIFAEGLSAFASDPTAAQAIGLPEILVKNEFVIFDIETTGLDRINDKITEIGAVRIKNGRLSETFSCFIDPQVPIPERITKLTGITDADVAGALLIGEALPDIFKFFDGAVLVGHNSESFDFPFLAHNALKEKIFFDNKRLDTYLLAKEHLSLDKNKLGDLAAHFGIVNTGAHRALTDAVATAKAFIAICKARDLTM
ncbi:MAG: exonuclease domain-containing protein [Firmicutes bacterium]|nr:exonuclease domain-containing protein [Bacillota bacterium]